MESLLIILTSAVCAVALGFLHLVRRDRHVGAEFLLTLLEGQNDTHDI